MSDIDNEMKAVADYAIKAARDRFGQELDYTDKSLPLLETILEKIYWGFSGHSKDGGEGGLIYNTAIIWGGYLGEYMRLYWGGTWILKGSDRLVSIGHFEFSPISMVYQKITSHPEYRLEDYLNDTRRILDTPVMYPQHAQYPSGNFGQFVKQIKSEDTKKTVAIDKHLIYAIVGIGGIFIVIIASIIGFLKIRSGGIPAVGFIPSVTSTNTTIPTEAILDTATASSTYTQSPTITTLPTYTPRPTVSPSPSSTPSPTLTQTLTSTPTETEIPFPTRTRTPTRTSTSRPAVPTDTPIPPTVTPTQLIIPRTPTPTSIPASPTNTQVPTEPPITVESCEVNPSTIPWGQDVTLTFIVHFSSITPGYDFQVILFTPNVGQNGCSGVDDGDGTASCNGSSGLSPDSTQFDVLMRTSVGDCTASYRSQ